MNVGRYLRGEDRHVGTARVTKPKVAEMNERIRELALQAGLEMCGCGCDMPTRQSAKFAELIVAEMCGLMEQAEDDAYHCFEPSERPAEYIGWLQDWQERFEKHFGVEE